MTAIVEPQQTVRLFDLPMNPMTMDEVIDVCRRSLATRETMQIGVVNGAKIVNASTDAYLRDSLLTCDLLLADGQSVVWASRLLGKPLPERVAGIEIFERLLEVAAEEGHSVYLLGATEEVLQKLLGNLRERFPTLVIAGARNGYYDREETPAIAEAIRDSKADMLFLGMTSPMKETFIADYGPILNVPVLHGVGGSFDVLAGLTKRAPRIWQKMGLEWLYRLLQEPGRLWRRYARTNTLFIGLTFKEMFRGRRASATPKLS
jgi:N-acetylglucosaminyldiphosphoundecaprenol N-acetyl-beta-D-mannosaminyltransferase